MQPIASQSKPQVASPDSSIGRICRQRPAQYQKVCDERKRPIRGLWRRNDRYYAQLTVEDAHSGKKQIRRVPLDGATSTAQAKQKLEELRVGRRAGKLPVLKRAPKFSDFADSYVKFHTQAKDAKRASTLKTEQYAIDRWKAHLGERRLDQIKRIHVDSFIAERQQDGKSARTVNLEVTVFRNVMKRAIDQRWILHLPTDNLRPLKSKPRKRQLFARAEIDLLLATCLKPAFIESRVAKDGEEGQALQNAQEFADSQQRQPDRLLSPMGILPLLLLSATEKGNSDLRSSL